MNSLMRMASLVLHYKDFVTNVRKILEHKRAK